MKAANQKRTSTGTIPFNMTFKTREKNQPCFNMYLGETTIKKSQNIMIGEVRADSGHLQGRRKRVFLKHGLIPKTWFFS